MFFRHFAVPFFVFVIFALHNIFELLAQLSINRQPADDRKGVVSSVGLERMLDRHEVGSSNLPRPTYKI